MVGGVRRALGEDLAGQRDAPVEILLADRVEGLDDRDLIQGRSLVAEHLGHVVDLVEPVPLVEQPHQPAGERGLDVPQLDRAEVMLDRLVGGTGELGDLAVQGEATRPLGTPFGDFRGELAGFVQVLGGAAADLVEQQSRPREPPGGPLVAFDLADLVHETGGVVVVAGRHGQVEQPEPDAEVVRLEVRQLAPVLPRQVRLAEPDLDRPRADRGTRAGRRRGSAARVAASFATAALAASPPSRPQ